MNFSVKFLVPPSSVLRFLYGKGEQKQFGIVYFVDIGPHTKYYPPIMLRAGLKVWGGWVIPRYQINDAQLALSLSFRDRLQYISRLRKRRLALLIC